MAKPARLKDLLVGALNKKEISLMPTSFDVVGDIMIFSNFPVELLKKEKKIGGSILNSFRQIKVVCKKTGKYGGKFRTPKLKIIAGERRKETVHKENGIRVNLNVENVYFSARLGHERERINSLIKKGERVLVMFSGCGVYCINIAKNTEADEVYGVEINPKAHKYALENVKLNKLNNVKLFLGDVNDVLPSVKGRFDRVLMPLPKSAEEFLDIALVKVNKGGVLHFYDFLHENEFSLSEEKVKEACKRNKRRCEVLRFVKCGQYSPGKYRVCVDVRIN